MASGAQPFLTIVVDGRFGLDAQNKFPLRGEDNRDQYGGIGSAREKRPVIPGVWLGAFHTLNGEPESSRHFHRQ